MARYIAVELDPSRSNPDDRPLGCSGWFLTGAYGERDIATFPSAASALNLASQSPNRRPGATVEAIGQSRKVRA